LVNSPEKYDLICVDAYRPPYIPPHLTTQEFFRIVADHLNPDGSVVINVGRAPNDRRLIDGLATTLGTIFASIHVMDIPNTFNSMVFATLLPTSQTALEQNLAALNSQGNVNALLLDSISLTLENLQAAPQKTVVFTDDRSPIEWITNTMILNFFLQGQMERMQ
jgi:spermidine synthase